jgi:hypothetical protein
MTLGALAHLSHFKLFRFAGERPLSGANQSGVSERGFINSFGINIAFKTSNVLIGEHFKKEVTLKWYPEFII